MTIEKKILVEGIEKQKERLDKLLKEDALDCILCPKRSCSVSFDESSYEAELQKRDWKKRLFEDFDKEKDSAVYIVFAPGFSLTKDVISKSFEDLKNDEKIEIKMCRIIHDNWNGNEPGNKEGCLYVGSSHNIVQRTREHLGNHSLGTYAMHLGLWFWKKQPNPKVTIEFWKTTELTNENQAYLQIIEDILWDHYKPLFGKRGAK